jgi:hypothetical protein
MSTTKKTVTLRWKREPLQRGLAGVCQGPRGWGLFWGPNDLASVRVLYKSGFGREQDGWYFVARNDSLGVDIRNTCGERGLPPDVVREACAAYVLEALRAAHPGCVFKAPTSCPGAEVSR